LLRASESLFSFIFFYFLLFSFIFFAVGDGYVILLDNLQFFASSKAGPSTPPTTATNTTTDNNTSNSTASAKNHVGTLSPPNANAGEVGKEEKAKSQGLDVLPFFSVSTVAAGVCFSGVCFSGVLSHACG
jgi:hypothetical protein